MAPENAQAACRPFPLLILLRHGEVSSHRGDVPLTRDGRDQAEQAGLRLGKLDVGRVSVLVGPTLRARQSGAALSDALKRANSGHAVARPAVTAALRNPDLYLAGHRVDMVSTAAHFAEQVSGVTEAQVTGVAFYAEFLAAADRIGHWLHHPDPPGDSAATVACRIRHFAGSLGYVGADLVVGITHSPVLRALGLHYAGTDPGEPHYLHGYAVRIQGDGGVALDAVDWNAAADPIPRQGGRQWSR
jgi:broad specificity phosphatase PhoE